MSTTSINNVFSNFGAHNVNDNAKKKTSEKNDSKEVEKKEQSSEIKQPKLSKKAQELLDKLRKKYDKMDFMVADYHGADEAKKILSRGTKEVSVLFSNKELEKMASDKNYEKECMDRIEGALKMSEEIQKEFAANAQEGEDGQNIEINQIGISFNGDGTVTYFAELEKTTGKQKERIDNAREKHAEEKKAEERKNDNRGLDVNKPVKRAAVTASSQEELINKMKEIDWSAIKEEKITNSGKFDFTI